MAWISNPAAKVAAAVSIGAAVLALAAKIGVPLATEFAARLPWTSIGAWLRPPYLYVIVNGIIISIAASSRFHNNNSTRRDHHPEEPDEKLSAATSAEDYRNGHHHHHHHHHDRQVSYDRNAVRMLDGDDDDDEVINVEVKEVIKEAADQDHDHDETLILVKKSVETLPKRRDIWEEDHEEDDDDILNLSAEKPMISPRLVHRKPAKPTTLEGGLRMSKPKQHVHDTLENTWKKITEGRSTPLSRQMRKCETLENNLDRQMVAMKKSETFKDRTNQQLPAVAPTLLRKETSLSHDELNKRVEAFIKKFNEDMRLQRQESLDQYMDMVNRGAH